MNITSSWTHLGTGKDGSVAVRRTKKHIEVFYPPSLSSDEIRNVLLDNGIIVGEDVSFYQGSCFGSALALFEVK